MKESSGLLRGSALLALARVLGSGASQLLYWMMAGNSMADLGTFRTVMVFFLASEVLPLLGMNQYLIREVAKDALETGACLRNAVRLSAPVTLAGGAALALLAYSGSYGADISRGLFWVILALPASAAVLIAQSILIGRGRSVTMGVLQSGETCLRTFLCIGLLLAGHGVDGVLAALALVRWLFAFVYILKIRPLLPAQPAGFDARRSFREFTAQLPTFAVITMLYMVFRFTAQALIALLRGEAEAGLFAVGYQVLDLVMLVPTAVAVNFMPILARQAASPRGLARSCGGMLAMVSAVVLPCTILAGRMADPLVRLVFPKAWPAAVPSVQFMLWAAFFLCLDQVLSVLLVASGRQTADMRSLAFGAAAIAALVPPAAYFHGATGAAGAFACVTVLLVCVRLRFARDIAPGLVRAGRLPLIMMGGAAMWLVTWAVPDLPEALLAGLGFCLAWALLFLKGRRIMPENP